MIAEQTLENMIVRDPKLRGGRPIVAGTGASVRTIAGLYKLGLSAEEIAGELPLTMGQVYAALAYYHLNRTEIDADIEADSEKNLIQGAGALVHAWRHQTLIVRRLLRLLNARSAEQMHDWMEYLSNWR